MENKYLHPIKGVSKEICTKEQVIAYNFMYRDFRLNCSATRIALQVWEEMHREMARYAGYDIKAICWLISNRGEAFRGLKYHILTSYEEVGKVFHLNG